MMKSPDKPSGRGHTLKVELLEPQRKLPRQTRSIALVEALKMAGREILEKQGRAALSLQSLAAEAGVAASSIYEYFPTLDSLVAAIFDLYREERFAELVENIRTLPHSATLFDGVILIAETVVQMRRHEIEIDRDVGIKRLQVDELQRLELLKADMPTPARATLELCRRFPGQIHAEHLDKLLFMIMQMMQSMVRVIALEKPEYLRERSTVVMLARMLHALLTTPSTE